jgi:hypothetical protein
MGIMESTRCGFFGMIGAALVAKFLKAGRGEPKMAKKIGETIIVRRPARWVYTPAEYNAECLQILTANIAKVRARDREFGV